MARFLLNMTLPKARSRKYIFSRKPTLPKERGLCRREETALQVGLKGRDLGVSEAGELDDRVGGNTPAQSRTGSSPTGYGPEAPTL